MSCEERDPCCKVRSPVSLRGEVKELRASDVLFVLPEFWYVKKNEKQQKKHKLAVKTLLDLWEVTVKFDSSQDVGCEGDQARPLNTNRRPLGVDLADELFTIIYIYLLYQHVSAIEKNKLRKI